MSNRPSEILKSPINSSSVKDPADLEQASNKEENDIPAKLTEDISWIPCKSMDWATIPKPILPSKEDFDAVETFVFDAINMRTDADTRQMDPEKQKSAALGYRAILDLLRKQDDVELLKKILLAIRTSGGGATLGLIIRNSKKHNMLIHMIFQMDPFRFDQRQKDYSGKAETDNIFQVDLDLADAYLNLILALVSANSVFLTPALNMLWRCIQNTDTITTEDRQLILHNNVFNSEERRDNMINCQFLKNSRLHGTLSKLLFLVPKGHSEIFPLIASNFPFKLAPLAKQACYVKQCFTVLNYAPTIRQNILELCIDKCLEIDVEIRIAQDGKVKLEEADAGEIEDPLKEGIFTMDEETETQEKNIEQEKIERIESKVQSKGVDQVDELAEKLDTLMYLTFQNLASASEIKSPKDLYKMIITTFDSVILTTHKSKFVQFVILFLCGLDHEKYSHDHHLDKEVELQSSEQATLSREFAAKLIDLVLDPFRPSINRQSAACYLASFVSRSKSVCAGTACEAVAAILRFAEAYMDTYHTAAIARNAKRAASTDFGSGNQTSKVVVHSLFYTVCQAAFYIMCFRGRECIEYYDQAVAYYATLDETHDDEQILLYTEPSLIEIGSKRWTRLVSHHLHPLKYCLESVRGEFLLLSDKFDLIDETVLNRLIIEDRKMASGTNTTASNSARKPASILTAATLEKRRINGGVGGLGRGSNPLDSFFPFDPYLLRRSYAFVDPYYRHWNGGDATHDDDDNDDESAVEQTCSVHDDEISVSDDSSSDESEQSHGGREDDESDDESIHKEHSLVEANECTPMSLTSTTCSVLGDDSENEITAEDMAVPKDTWIAELKRARALSVEDCW